ncbi:MAG: hypothetical protein PHY59_01900 [Methanobacterium sp.]|nr:hypothetical protein [Methanobacterium sp.]
MSNTWVFNIRTRKKRQFEFIVFTVIGIIGFF